MGFVSSVRNKINGILSNDFRDQLKQDDLKKGYERIPLGGISSNSGISDLTRNLENSEELLRRYSDYEEMDAYPEIGCISGDSLIFIMRDGWVPIRELVDRKEFYVLSYDKERNSLVPALAKHARVTAQSGHSKKMVKVVMDNGQSIVCTDDHKFMEKDGSWAEAGNLKCGDRLKPGNIRMRHLSSNSNTNYWQVHQPDLEKYDLIVDHSNHRVAKVISLDSCETIYDLEVPEYHNFVCNGTVIHNSALDVFADDATIPDLYHNMSIWATSDDRVIRIILDDLLHNRLKVEEDIWNVARTISQYGNNPAEILVTDIGVVGLNLLPVPTVKRVETEKGTLIGFVQDMYGRVGYSTKDIIDAIKSGTKMVNNAIVFEPWEIVHWRLMGKDSTDMYGTSVLDSARWIFKRLAMLEDSALVQKLQNTAKYAFYVDVGDLVSNEALAYVNQVRQMYTKKKFLNTATSRVDFRPNPMSQNTNFWIPTRAGNDSTRIDVVSPPEISTIEEMEYFREKLFSAIKVPRSYLGFGGESNRSSLSQEDARFARTVMRIQRSIRLGYYHVCRVHLAALGIDPDTVKFDIKMSVPSAIFQMAQIELRNAQADNASNLEDFFDKDWIMKHVFDFSKEDAAFANDAKKAQDKQDIQRQYETQAEMMKKYPELSDAELPELEGEAAVESVEIKKFNKMVQKSGLLRMISEAMSPIVEKQQLIHESTMKELRKDRRRSYAVRK